MNTPGQSSNLPQENNGYKNRRKSIHYPKVNGGPMTRNWIKNISFSKELSEKLCFPESLLIVNNCGESIGKMFTSVVKSQWSDKECFLIHSGTFAKLENGLECGTSIIGFIDMKLNTLQEYTWEWAKICNKVVERKTFLINEEAKMFCKIIAIENNHIKEEKKFPINLEKLDNLFEGEAFALLFQRLVVIEKKFGEIDLLGMDQNGEIVRNNFKQTGTGFECVNSENVRVWSIKRTVYGKTICPNDKIETWDSLYNYFGRLVLKTQEDNCYKIIPLWFKSVEEYDSFGNFVGTRYPLFWATDLQLHSSYLIHKEKLFMDYKAYFLEHKNLRAILSDLLQNILMRKCENLIDFCADFFQPFLPFKTPLPSELNSDFDTFKTDSQSQTASFKSQNLLEIEIQGEEDLEEGIESSEKDFGKGYLYPILGSNVDI